MVVIVIIICYCWSLLIISKDEVQFLAEQTSSIHEEEQENLVTILIFFVSSCSDGTARILLCAISHTQHEQFVSLSSSILALSLASFRTASFVFTHFSNCLLDKMEEALGMLISFTWTIPLDSYHYHSNVNHPI